MQLISLQHDCEHISGKAEEELLHFQNILERRSLTALFQPIVDFQRRSVMGYESLIRGPSDSPLHNPMMLFDAAIRYGRLTDLDLLCRRQGIKSFKEKGLTGKLFLNTTPQGLLEPGHRTGLTLEFLQEFGLKPDDVIIELTEQYPLTDFSVMVNALEHYRRMGFQIAIDDLGAGYSGLRRWSELRPEYVKIDRHFIQGVCKDPVKRAFVTSISGIARDLGCKVVAEGIESIEDYGALLEIGIDYGQGYYFSRPEAEPPAQVAEDRFNLIGEARQQLDRSRTTVLDLLHEAPCLTPENLLEDAYHLFASSPHLTAVPVTDHEGIPLGLIRRSAILTTFSTTYGRSLHGGKPVLEFTDRSALSVELDWSIEQVSNLVTRSMKSQIESDFIIVERGVYAGLGSVLDLLKKITDLQIRNARYANPLTLLPGNVPIYELVDNLLQDKRDFVFAYCDIDNFKPYNDVYGYAGGDRVISLVADLLRRHIRDPDFIGHVGGDDFIIVFTNSDWQESCEKVLRSFSEEIAGYYTREHTKEGGIAAVSREGKACHYPIMTLSIGIVRPNVALQLTHGDIAAMASRAKASAKKLEGNSLFVERRQEQQDQAPRTQRNSLPFSFPDSCWQ